MLLCCAVASAGEVRWEGGGNGAGAGPVGRGADGVCARYGAGWEIRIGTRGDGEGGSGGAWDREGHVVVAVVAIGAGHVEGVFVVGGTVAYYWACFGVRF